MYLKERMERLRQPKAFLAGWLVACIIALSGCGVDGAVIWQADTTSEDGGFRVHAETFQQSGLGTAAVYSEVTLIQEGQEQGVGILSLTHHIAPKPGTDAVRMTWIGPKKLRLQYLPESHVDFQAVRAIDVEIEAVPQS